MTEHFLRGCKGVWTGLLLPCIALAAFVAAVVVVFVVPFYYVNWMIDNHWGLLTLIPVVPAVITVCGWLGQERTHEPRVDREYDAADHESYYR